MYITDEWSSWFERELDLTIGFAPDLLRYTENVFPHLCNGA